MSPAVSTHDIENAAQRERGVIDLDRIAVEPYALESQRERPGPGVVDVGEMANVGVDGADMAAADLLNPCRERAGRSGRQFAAEPDKQDPRAQWTLRDRQAMAGPRVVHRYPIGALMPIPDSWADNQPGAPPLPPTEHRKPAGCCPSSFGGFVAIMLGAELNAEAERR